MSIIARAATILLTLAVVGQARSSLAQLSSTGGPKLEAKLVDPEKNAQRQAATVQVTVHGLEMVDPASAGERPQKGQGHLHYTLDDGPVIATTSTKLSFHGLKPGEHRFVVALAANDHSPLGPESKVTVTVPVKKADAR